MLSYVQDMSAEVNRNMQRFHFKLLLNRPFMKPDNAKSSCFVIKTLETVNLKVLVHSTTSCCALVLHASSVLTIAIRCQSSLHA